MLLSSRSLLYRYAAWSYTSSWHYKENLYRQSADCTVNVPNSVFDNEVIHDLTNTTKNRRKIDSNANYFGSRRMLLLSYQHLSVLIFTAFHIWRTNRRADLSTGRINLFVFSIRFLRYVCAFGGWNILLLDYCNRLCSSLYVFGVEPWFWWDETINRCRRWHQYWFKWTRFQLH